VLAGHHGRAALSPHRRPPGGPRYRWLTESLFVGQGRLAGDHRIEYEICRVG
jgi:hypothetical protein